MQTSTFPPDASPNSKSRSLIPNCNDGSGRPPRLRFDMNIGSISSLASFTSFPHAANPGSLEAYQFMAANGIEGLDWGTPEICRQAGLHWTGGGRFDSPEEVEIKVTSLKEAGMDCGVFHVGTGFESDSEMDDFATAIIEAASRHAFPIFVETHRSTLTQDIYRTVTWVERNPDLRFNCDFSHYYTGHEMIYSDFSKKLDLLAPVFERVRFIHGRIGNSCCMQIEVSDLEAPNVKDFREVWTRCFLAFQKTAAPGDFISFTPELLAPGINYARTFRNAEGQLQEETDRWEQVLLYLKIAQDCWKEAERRATA